MPAQSIAEDKSTEYVTHRNLSLEDLLSQLKHYNKTVRKGIETDWNSVQKKQ
jgi:hypothetical protein